MKTLVLRGWAPLGGAILLSSAFLLCGAALPAAPASSISSSSPSLSAFLAASPAPPPAGALFHGLVVRMAREGGVVVASARYDGGGPAAAAQVTLFAPGREAPYQTGSTDGAGLFAFVPDAPGEWRVVVDDGMGHRREARVEVGGEGDPVRDSGHGQDQSADPDHEHDHGADSDHAHDQGLVDHTHDGEGSDRPWKLATGLSLIFGLTGFAYGFSARRQAGGAAPTQGGETTP